MIEKASVNDYEQICCIGEFITNKFKKLYSIDSLFNEYNHILIYKENGKIIGFIHYEILQETVNILNVVVDPKYRRKNVGSMLLDNMLSSLCNKSINNIMLEVNEFNISAINLYKKFNFEIIHTRKKYYQDGDACIMERRVK